MAVEPWHAGLALAAVQSCGRWSRAPGGEHEGAAQGLQAAAQASAELGAGRAPRGKPKSQVHVTHGVLVCFLGGLSFPLSQGTVHP